MIDLHCHVLAGIDDGPETIEGSVAFARAAEAEGIDTLVATPHVNWRYANTSKDIEGAVIELHRRLRVEGVTVTLRTGAEVALTRAAELEDAELARLRLGAGPWLLLEPPSTPMAVGLEGMVATVQARGHRIVLAHPERCAAFHRDPHALGSLVRAGALTSITAGSLVGEFGGTVRRFTQQLLREGLVHNVVSDAHSHDQRPPVIRERLEEANLGELAEWLTCEVPAAILAGGEIPERPPFEVPEAAVSRLRRRRRRGGSRGLFGASEQ